MDGARRSRRFVEQKKSHRKTASRGPRPAEDVTRTPGNTCYPARNCRVTGGVRQLDSCRSGGPIGRPHEVALALPEGLDLAQHLAQEHERPLVVAGLDLARYQAQL